MSDMTLRDVPEDLLEFLKADAAGNHRSLDEHVISALCQYRVLQTRHAAAKQTPEQKRAAANMILASIRRKLASDSPPQTGFWDGPRTNIPGDTHG